MPQAVNMVLFVNFKLKQYPYFEFIERLYIHIMAYIYPGGVGGVTMILTLCGVGALSTHTQTPIVNDPKLMRHFLTFPKYQIQKFW